MSKKTLINIVSIILLIVVLGGVFFLVHSTKSSNDEDQNKVEDKKSENVGPALTGNGDRQDNNSNSDDNTEDEKDTKTKKESNNDEKDKSEKDSSKEKSSNSKKDQTSELTKNADYVYKKTIKGTEDSSEEHINDIATDKMIKQIEGADSNNASKEIDLRNTSIKFKDTHDFSDKTISGTYKYDLIIKDKENKQGSITRLDETSNIKFIKEDGQYKVDEISK
ncbi:hypothetical protein [Staphylococcus hominis]|uniref:Uncharacterized protein n=1 Tax=Staphylococcus hominis TaxID=1290 RepID=A0A8X8GPQ1_STAHO|nr:hypothetical protein [Staphylococcus hominis]MCM5672983.1 hypothetical protein [Staphylococcus hominis]